MIVTTVITIMVSTTSLNVLKTVIESIPHCVKGDVLQMVTSAPATTNPGAKLNISKDSIPSNTVVKVVTFSRTAAE